METRIWTGLDPDYLVTRAPALETAAGGCLLDSSGGGRWCLSGLSRGVLVPEGEAFVFLPSGDPASPGDGAAGPAPLADWFRPWRGPGDPRFPFRGGWMGYLGYGVGHLLDRIPPEAPDPEAAPLLELHWMEASACLDREEGVLYLASDGRRAPGAPPDPARARACLDELESRLARTPSPVPELPGASELPPRLPDPSPFEAGVVRAREAIARGDVFQVNLAQRFDLGAVPDPWASYLKLRSLNPAPYAGFHRGPGVTLVSASPELLVETRGRRVVTWPIAGTHPRGRDPEEDRQIRRELRSHPKEQAEHIMLVDLERNDLGRVCVPGTVRVPELLGIRSYASVHHLVSVVEGELRAEVLPFEVLRALFPGGTITGAPKIRATEIIRELEPVPRGPYTGSLGFLDGSGEQTWNILIRTLVVREGRGSLHAGAGIVWDSIPEREFREAVQKAKPFLLRAGVDLRGRTLEEDSRASAQDPVPIPAAHQGGRGAR